MTFFPPLLSEVRTIDNTFVSTLHPGRAFFSIPFICIMSVIGFKYFYTYITSRNYSARPIFIFLIILFFCFRIYGYQKEIKIFNTEIIHSYKIDFSQPAITDNIISPYQDPRLPLRNKHYDQVYFYRMAELVSNHLKTINLKSNSLKLLYIPSEIYTPSKYKNFAGNLSPRKGHPYYFPMYLTFYLQEQGINVSYLVKKKDVKKNFLKKVLIVLDRYRQGKNLPPGISLSARDLGSKGHYPRNKTQEDIVKMFNKIIFWMENYEHGKRWLDSIRKQTHFNQNISSVGNYFLNITSNKTPDYLIITNKEELNQVQEQSNYKLVLSLPL